MKLHTQLHLTCLRFHLNQRRIYINIADRLFRRKITGLLLRWINVNGICDIVAQVNVTGIRIQTTMALWITRRVRFQLPAA